MNTDRSKTLRMVMLAMMVAIGVVISPILRIEGMCPTAHLINIVCSVLLGPWYSLLCATLIGIIRMMFMGIPPLALTGAVFGAFLSGVFYRASHGKIICAVIGEIFGTGIIGSLVSYPVMAFLMGRSGLNAFFYTPMFLAATCMGGTIAYFFLKALSHAGMLAKFQQSYCTPDKHRLFRTSGTVVFIALCHSHRNHPNDVYGYPATCTDRCRIWRIFIRRFLPRFSWKDYLRSDR